MPTLIELGKILRPHGHRGGVVVRLLGGEVSAFLKPGVAVLAGVDEGSALAQGPLEVAKVQRRPNGDLIVALGRTKSAQDCAALRGASLFARREEIEEGLGEDEFLVSDLVGMDVVNENAKVGTVLGSYNAGAGEIVVVDTGDGLVDFPLCDENLEVIDFKNRRLKIKGFGDYLEFKYKELEADCNNTDHLPRHFRFVSRNGSDPKGNRRRASAGRAHRHQEFCLRQTQERGRLSVRRGARNAHEGRARRFGA